MRDEYVLIKTETLTEWANETRRASGVSGELTTAQMLELLKNVEDGGFNFQNINNQDITVIENGVYTFDGDYTGLGVVTVDVPSAIPENGRIYYVGAAQSAFDGLNFTTTAVGELSE